MATILIELPDELEHDARNAGLLSTEAMAEMLRLRLRSNAAQALHELWQRLPADDLTPGIEEDIDAAVHELRRRRERAGDPGQ